MGERFSTLTEAITSVFKDEGTSLLSLDKICQALSNPDWVISMGNNGDIPTSSISRRRISSILSSSDLFVRAGPPRSCMWALQPQNPLFSNDSALLTHIEQVMTEHGPITTDEIVTFSELPEANESNINEFLTSHPQNFTLHPNNRWWFANQPYPLEYRFDSVIGALLFAFETLNRDASIEELNWFLCLSVDGKNQKISRRKISRELSRRPDLFSHISRAKYSLINKSHEPKKAMLNKLPHIQFPPPVITPMPTISQDFALFDDPKIGLNGNWGDPDPLTIQICETPPTVSNDFFDPQDFFAIGFTGFGDSPSFLNI